MSLKVSSIIISQAQSIEEKKMFAEQSGERIDKWLWASRFFKTRSLAKEAVELGRVRIDGERMKPSREVRSGDKLQIERAGVRFDVVVAGTSDTRGPACDAQKLYEETLESRQRRERLSQLKRYAEEPADSIRKGRPTKRDARKLRAFKYGQS